MTAMLREQLSRIGWPGIVAIGLAFFCLSFYFSAVVPLQQQRAELARQPVTLAAPRIHTTIENIDNRLHTPEQLLQQFYQRFPSIDTVPQLLDTLYRAAAAHGLSLDKGEYLPHTEKNRGLVRYQITLPVKGSYPQLRRFVRAVLQTIPNATLESLRLEKQHVGDNTVTAELRLVIYLGGAH